ncbi:hypothetical protein AV654_25745 [Paenibacillus elgii]|uniref:Fibronectin type-III domain-containing protein n=1 Tax=Paenibacillus elgii TaxID=189691 RepID=A0A163W548_9BACL|nr:hypothetical protein [Paenibacillus elgii]KZE75868.1 hypothetical protein AV654_25745 [Paenibacillus elgii]
MKLPKRALLMTILSIVLALGFSTASFAAAKILLPNQPANNPAIFSSPPSYLVWSQSPTDDESRWYFSTANGDFLNGSWTYPAGSTVRTYYLSQGEKDALPRNTLIKFSVYAYSKGSFTGGDSGYFIVQN